MAEISIVIPCYKPEAEKLQRCMTGILNQSFRDFEVIIVDDGNTPEDLETIRRMAGSDDRITILSQENKGVSAARNRGIMHASGRYTAFADADDFVFGYYLAEAFHIAETTHSDIVIGGVKKVSGEKTDYSFNDEYETKTYTGDQVGELKKYMVGNRITFEDGGYINSGPVARLIRTDLVRKVPFPEDVSIGEDMIWNLMLFDLAETVTIAKRVWYLYFYNENSASHKYNPNVVQVLKKQAEMLKEHMDLSDDRNYYAYCDNLILSLRFINDCYINHPKAGLTSRQRRQEERKLYADPLFRMIDSDRFYRQAGRSDKLKYGLFKTHQLFRFWNLLDHVKRLKGKSGW